MRGRRDRAYEDKATAVEVKSLANVQDRYAAAAYAGQQMESSKFGFELRSARTR